MSFGNRVKQARQRGIPVIKQPEPCGITGENYEHCQKGERRYVKSEIQDVECIEYIGDDGKHYSQENDDYHGIIFDIPKYIPEKYYDRK